MPAVNVKTLTEAPIEKRMYSDNTTLLHNKTDFIVTGDDRWPMAFNMAIEVITCSAGQAKSSRLHSCKHQPASFSLSTVLQE